VSRLARLLAAMPGPGRRRGGAPARLGEREARDVLAMPQGHPESLTRPLRRADERLLTALCGELWPHDEYAREL
jgi:hypothetical protein